LLQKLLYSVATINTVGTCDIIQKKQFITMTAINTQVKKNWENVGHSDKRLLTS